MRKFLNNIMSEESGQGLAEYALIVSLIAVALAGVLRAFKVKIEDVFNGMNFN